MIKIYQQQQRELLIQ